MTRIFLLSLLPALCGTLLQAQITITNASFPAAGDSVWIATAADPAAITPGGSGMGITWDFTALVATNEVLTVARPAAEGSKPASFPGTNLVLLSSVGEAYYAVDASALVNHGFIGTGGFPLSESVEPKYLPPLVEQRAPLSFFDVNTAESALAFTFPASFLPDSLLAGLPLQPDSIRFSQTFSRLDVVDASGTLKLPTGDYEVLRERRRTISDTKVELLIGLFWIDLSTVFPLPGLGADTTLAYYFFSNEAKGPLAVVDVVPDTPTTVLNVQFRGTGATSTHQPVVLEARIFKGPVPSAGDLYFDATPAGRPVRAELYNLAGQPVLISERHTGAFRLDTASLPPGLWIYRVTDGDRLVESGTLILQR